MNERSIKRQMQKESLQVFDSAKIKEMTGDEKLEQIKKQNVFFGDAGVNPIFMDLVSELYPDKLADAHKIKEEYTQAITKVFDEVNRIFSFKMRNLLFGSSRLLVPGNPNPNKIILPGGES